MTPMKKNNSISLNKQSLYPKNRFVFTKFKTDVQLDVFKCSVGVFKVLVFTGFEGRHPLDGRDVWLLAM